MAQSPNQVLTDHPHSKYHECSYRDKVKQKKHLQVNQVCTHLRVVQRGRIGGMIERLLQAGIRLNLSE